MQELSRVSGRYAEMCPQVTNAPQRWEECEQQRWRGEQHERGAETRRSVGMDRLPAGAESRLSGRGRCSERGGARPPSRQPCISRCLSPGCLRPFPWLAPVSLGHLEAAVLPELAFRGWQGAPALSQRLSVFSSPRFQQGECISLRLRTPTYLEFAGSWRFSCVGFGTSRSLSYFSSIWARNMPTRISLNSVFFFFFLNPGLRPKGVCTQTLWVSSPITVSCLPPRHPPPNTSHRAAWHWVPEV